MTFVEIAWIALLVLLTGTIVLTSAAIFMSSIGRGNQILNSLSGLFAVFFVITGVVNLIANAPRQPTCVAQPGQKVVWVHSSDSSRFVYVDQGAKLYCKVYDNRLYYLGIGTVLDAPYEGYPETRP
jgi:ATP/ADP translocase